MAVLVGRGDIALRRDGNERRLRIIASVGIQVHEYVSEVVGPLVSGDRESLTSGVEARKPLLAVYPGLCVKVRLRGRHRSLRVVQT